MKGRYLLALILLVSLTAGVAAADVSGQPDLSATLSANQVDVGDEMTLKITVSNAGNLDEGSTRNPALNERVTVARSVQLGLTRASAPLTVESGRQLVGSLPQGARAGHVRRLGRRRRRARPLPASAHGELPVHELHRRQRR
jgi:hypothetical protein